MVPTGRRRKKPGFGRIPDPKMFLAVFLLSFIVLSLSTAKNINVYDVLSHAKLIETREKSYDPLFLVQNSFGTYGNDDGGGRGFSRSSLYVLLSYSVAFALKNFAGTELVLNLLSGFFVSVSAAFVYLTSVYLTGNRTVSFSGSLLYTLVPYVFFNGINAGGWAMQMMLASIWLFMAIKGAKERNNVLVLGSSVAVLLGALTYLSSSLLMIPQLYIIMKHAGNGKHRIYNLAVLLPVVLLVLYFTTLNKAYPFEYSVPKMAFGAAMLVWESVNGFTVPLFLAASYASLKSLRAVIGGTSGLVQKVFMLSVTPLIPSLSIFHYAPIFNFNPVIPLLAVLVIYEFRKTKNLCIFLIVLALLLPKAAFLYDQFHNYDHPHKLYAMWLSGLVGNGTVLAGHECPAVMYYTNVNVLCDDKNLESVNGNLYVTSQYLDNENRMELRYLASLAGVPDSSVERLLGKKAAMDSRNLELVGSFAGDSRTMEDNFEFLFSVYPSPLANMFYYSSFPKAGYKLYRVV